MRKKELRHVSTLAKSQPMNWKKCLESRPVGFLLQCYHESRALPLGPLATPHFFTRGLMDPARKLRTVARSNSCSPILCVVSKNHLPFCCLGLPVCKMEIKCHCCTSLYSMKLQWLMINEIMEGTCCTPGQTHSSWSRVFFSSSFHILTNSFFKK